MKKRMRNLLSLCLALAVTCGLSLPAMAADGTAADASEDGIVVLYTNDVHCTSDDGMAYAAIAGYKAQMEAVYGAGNVTLVDNGDAIQGGILGSMSNGSWIVDIMNHVGYDIAIPGNHEFDFKMDTFLDIAKNQAEYTYVSCNFVDAAGKPVLEPYKMVTYGDVDVAYVGISTPETLTKSAPAYFQNEAGQYVYGFCQGGDGKELYDQVQSTVDAARKAGAEYVVALAHLGVDAQSSPWMSTEVIANTTGIDAVLDGHSHTVEPTKLVANAEGKNVLLTQTGTKAESVGKLVISPDGAMTAELVPLADVDTATQAYTDAKTFVEGIQNAYKAKAEEVVATSAVDLTIKDPDSGNRAVRSAETNLGDLCADAYRVVLGADIGWVNGGGVRDNIAAGDITYGEVIAVHPFGNLACLVEVTGQQVLDALEMGSRQVGISENGGFLQVSGLKYTIDPTVPSSVELDDAGNFVKVAGARRVKDVQVLDSKTGAYAPIDPKATYTLASHNYMLKDGGDGYAMFGSDNIKLLQDEVMVDNEVLITYIKDHLNGVVGEQYAAPRGQGRITIPGTATRGAVYQALYELAGKPAASDKAAFTDVEGKDYAGAAAWAKANGLTNGSGNGLFEGDRAITRAELATALGRYAALTGVTVEEGGMSMREAADYDQIPAWALEGLSFCYYGGLMTTDADGALNFGAPLLSADLDQMLDAFAALKPAKAA